MGKKYYSDYVRHYIRLYLNENDEIINSIDEKAFNSCENVLILYNKDTVKALFNPSTTPQEAVIDISKKEGIKESVLWGMIRNIERDIALEMGII